MTAPTPVTVVSAARLQDLATPNIGDVLNTLPSFRASTNPSTNNIQPREAGSIQADLRGLGPNRTLVLVDGHRFVPSTIEQTVDLNQIPSMLVQRAEVVTGGASAQYGSDAVAGVVNILLNRKLQGVQTQLQYGRAEAGDGKDTVADLAAVRTSRASAAMSSPPSSTKTTRVKATATAVTGAPANIRTSPTPPRPPSRSSPATRRITSCPTRIP